MFVAPEWDVLVRVSYSASPGTHAMTQRWEYTVPAGRYAVVEHVFADVEASTAVNSVRAVIDVRDSGGATIGNVVVARSLTSQWVSVSYSPHLILDEGERLRGSTLNGDAVGRSLIVDALIREIAK